MSSQLFLVTGAAGFLGSAICRVLREQNIEVRALILPGDKYAKYLPKGVQICEGDLSDKNSLYNFFNVTDYQSVYVIHCGSIVTVKPAFSQKVYDVNVTGTENVIHYCQQLGNKLQKLVYVGSTGTLGSKSGDALYFESSYFDPEHLPDCYSQTKAMASNKVLDFANTGHSACIVMPTGIMGPDDFSYSTTTTTLIEIISGKMPMGIDGTFNLADVRDLAVGVYKASQYGRSGECYILGNQPISFRDFADTISRAADTPPIKRFLSCKTARKMARMMEFFAHFTHKDPLLTTYSVDVLAQSNRYSSAKAIRELGYQTRPYEETIKDEILFLREHGMI